MNVIGIDIGGTKCAIIYGVKQNSDLTVVDKVRFLTTGINETIEKIFLSVEQIMSKHELSSDNTAAIGISCGGPLDCEKGIIMSPPNLPDWDNIPIVEMVSSRFGIPAVIQNDANACALAEWQFGAGKGSRNMVFLTFGTGLGAGLIIDGKLYVGTNGNAGEVGHIRLSDYGPVGYGKGGSFEGFCSGGGIAQLAMMRVREKKQMGQTVDWCPEKGVENITAQIVAQAAYNGDALAQEIIQTSSEFLGRGLSMIIDVLNPDTIVIGSIYTRNETMMKPYMLEIIKKEALSVSSNVCEVKAALLGENVGDYAAVSVAVNYIKEIKCSKLLKTA